MDDFLILARDASDKDSFKAAISAAFKMKDLGAVAHFLGMEVQRSRSGHAISLTSSQHIDDMLQRFGMQDCKPAATPLPHKAVLGPRGPSWGEDPSTRKSQSGYVFTLGNAAISWKSKLQTTVWPSPAQRLLGSAGQQTETRSP